MTKDHGGFREGSAVVFVLGSCVWLYFEIAYFTYEKECSFLATRQETNQRNAPRTDEPTVRRLGSTTPSCAPVVPRSGTPRARQVGCSRGLVAPRRAGRKRGRVPHSRIPSGRTRGGEKLCLRLADSAVLMLTGDHPPRWRLWVRSRLFGLIFCRRTAFPSPKPPPNRPFGTSGRAATLGRGAPRFPGRDSRVRHSAALATLPSQRL